MVFCQRILTIGGAWLLATTVPYAAQAQKHGGVLQVYTVDSPASMSIHEEQTVFAERPMLGVFNNLITFDPKIRQNSINSIVPDLATEWSWNEDGTELTLKLRQGVKWHDGKPFTAADVKCTWDLVTGVAKEKLRVNPRKPWYRNLEEVTTSGDYEVRFRLKQPQPAFVMMLASGFSRSTPATSLAQMRQHPIGTGPFKFVEFKPNQDIKVTRNPEYWKKDRPYLDGIEWTVIKNMSTAVLGLVSGKFDLSLGLTIPNVKNVREQLPDAQCDLSPGNVSRNLIVNRNAPPFDNADLRRAMALSIDQQAYIDILTEGLGKIGGVMLPPPEGIWGMPPDVLHKLPGYDPDISKRREEARQIMKKLGYGPDKHLAVKISTRDLPFFREPAVILNDQLKADLYRRRNRTDRHYELVPEIMRKDYSVGMNLTGNSLDDPDQNFFENFLGGGLANIDGYCNPAVEKLMIAQSMEANQDRRKTLVWEIERLLAEGVARPMIFYAPAANCWNPKLKGLTIPINGIYNSWRMEDAWLDN
jgi:peptide/nickel transport system substrate-binding protein